MTGEPVVDAATGEPTGELELAFEELASTFDFELFIDPNNNQRKIGKIGKIPGQTPPGQTPNHYGYYYVQWYGDVRYLFLKRKTADNGVQDGKSIMRWVSGEGLEAQFEFWDNVNDDTNFGYGSVGGIGGVGLGAPDAVYRTLDRVADPSVWYLPAEYRSQYSFGRHL
jgi:hypothetical protein